VWSQLFIPNFVSHTLLVSGPLAIILAEICVVSDTFIWLSTCFAFASPMLLNGFYEAYIDYIIINFLQEKTEDFRLTLGSRARLLFVILYGNVSVRESFRYL
jgi:hypothetical protein